MADEVGRVCVFAMPTAFRGPSGGLPFCKRRRRLYLHIPFCARGSVYQTASGYSACGDVLSRRYAEGTWRGRLRRSRAWLLT